MIGDRERCLQAGMDDHITSMSISFVPPSRFSDVFFFRDAEPLRRGDLLNAIGKLAGERGAAKPHRRVPPGLEALRFQDIPR